LLLQLINVHATFRYREASQRFQLGVLEDLELRVVRESLQKRFGGELLNFSSRPRDVLPERFAGTHNY
jgi:hypothetical protein